MTETKEAGTAWRELMCVLQSIAEQGCPQLPERGINHDPVSTLRAWDYIECLSGRYYVTGKGRAALSERKE